MGRKDSVFVTSYRNPDIDGVACSISYSEYLCKKGIDAIAVIFGKPHREAIFVLKKFGISLPRNGGRLISKDSRVILTDTSSLNNISRNINPKNVVEIIDHRKLNEVYRFPNAKVQIELVGSCATLVSEKFREDNVELLSSSAALLYSAVVSNTINFKNNITTERDKEISDWLLKRVSIPSTYVREMFLAKSQVDRPIKNILKEDVSIMNFEGKVVPIFQLEIVDVDAFLETHLDVIKNYLEDYTVETRPDIVFLSCIDLEKAFNVFVALDGMTQRILERILNVRFRGVLARREGIIMRKEIGPLIKEYLERIS